MPTVLGVLLLQSVAQLCHHGLVVGPLPVVDDQSAGAAGEQLLTESELTTITPVSVSSDITPVFSTLIGRGMSRLVSHWSRA